MAIPNQHFTPCSSSFLSPKPSPPFSSLPYPTTHSKTPLKSISSSSSTRTSSPFTESHSIERYQRDSWLYNDPSPKISCSIPYDPNSARDDDIALQLPELKKLLQVLREKREKDGSFDGGARGPGNVFLVGTGPGDPELLTLKALRAIESADLLLYDRLVSTDVLDLVRRDARLLYVGKTAGYHSRTQEEIHELLLSFAEVGATVVRLKGGDPLIPLLQQQANRIPQAGEEPAPSKPKKKKI